LMHDSTAESTSKIRETRRHSILQKYYCSLSGKYKPKPPQ
jgi:hypothetical protein